MFIREVADPVLASQHVAYWGYPRKLDESELDCPWLSYGDPEDEPIGYAWFLPGPEPRTLAVHACARPDSHHWLGTPRNLQAVAFMAEILGAIRVYSLLPKGELGTGLPVGAMRRYLRIRGWSEDFYGAYLDLGG